MVPLANSIIHSQLWYPCQVLLFFQVQVPVQHPPPSTILLDYQLGPWSDLLPTCLLLALQAHPILLLFFFLLLKVLSQCQDGILTKVPLHHKKGSNKHCQAMYMVQHRHRILWPWAYTLPTLPFYLDLRL